MVCPRSTSPGVAGSGPDPDSQPRLSPAPATASQHSARLSCGGHWAVRGERWERPGVLGLLRPEREGRGEDSGGEKERKLSFLVWLLGSRQESLLFLHHPCALEDLPHLKNGSYPSPSPCIQKLSYN